MSKLKENVEKRKEILYNHMENEGYVTPSMLDDALDVINAQNKYIEELEIELAKALNHIEDIHILELMEERKKNDNGKRYTLEDLKKHAQTRR